MDIFITFMTCRSSGPIKLSGECCTLPKVPFFKYLYNILTIFFLVLNVSTFNYESKISIVDRSEAEFLLRVDIKNQVLSLKVFMTDHFFSLLYNENCMTLNLNPYNLGYFIFSLEINIIKLDFNHITFSSWQFFINMSIHEYIS